MVSARYRDRMERAGETPPFVEILKATVRRFAPWPTAETIPERNAIEQAIEDAR